MNPENDTNDTDIPTPAPQENAGPTPADGTIGQPSEPGFTEPTADRPPTEEEAAIAERLAADVDLERVGEHYEEAMHTGADISGEGQITPE